MHRHTIAAMAAAALFLVPVSITTASRQSAARPTDPEIAHIAYTAGVIDIDAAKQALAKSKTAAVRSFAEDMLRDHQAVNVQALALVKKLNVTPADNDTSRALAKAAAAKRADLAKLDGAAFDRAYVDNEVAFHKTVNGALEQLLIPSATNGELKALLETGLKLFQGHEQHAMHTAAGIAKAASRPSASVTRITIHDMAFAPARVAVRVGDTIEFVNTDVVTHTATTSSTAWREVVVPAGQTGRVVVTRAGAVGYYCRFHPNMTGSVTAS